MEGEGQKGGALRRFLGTKRIPRDHARLRFPRIRARIAGPGHRIAGVRAFSVAARINE